MGWAAQRRVLSVPFEESRTRPGSWKGDWSPESAHVSNNTFNFNLQAFKNSHIHEQLRQCTTQLASNLHLLPCTRKWCGRRPPGRQHEETRKVMEVAGVDGHTLSRCLLPRLPKQAGKEEGSCLGVVVSWGSCLVYYRHLAAWL